MASLKGLLALVLFSTAASSENELIGRNGPIETASSLVPGHEMVGLPLNLPREQAAASPSTHSLRKLQSQCTNTRDNTPGAFTCALQISWGNSCQNYLQWKDCDQACSLCACSTAYATNKEHCSGHGTCVATCNTITCSGASCQCNPGWVGSKCEQEVPTLAPTRALATSIAWEFTPDIQSYWDTERKIGGPNVNCWNSGAKTAELITATSQEYGIRYKIPTFGQALVGLHCGPRSLSDYWHYTHYGMMTWGDGCACSYQTIVGSDGQQPYGQGYNDWTYKPTWVKSSGPKTFEVRLNADRTKVEYVVDSVVIHTAKGTPTFPMHIDVSLCSEYVHNLEILRATSLTTTTTATTSTSTKTATTSTSTKTATATTTTTTTAGANCTSTHMTCPVPSVASGTYILLGSENATECSMRSSGGEAFFHFVTGVCNSTRKVRVASNLVEETVTLIYRPPSSGTLLVGSQRNGGAGVSAVVVCTCTAPLTAVAGSGAMQTAPDKEAQGQSNVVGDTEFKVSFQMYATDSFDTVLPMGGLLPDASERLFFRVSSHSPTDTIGLVNCTASPTSSITDPYAARFLSSSCPMEPLDYRAHSETETHAINSSLLNFKFAGSTDVFIWCSVVRCLTDSCGECASSPSRRLGVATPVGRQLQSQGTLAQAWFQVQYSESTLILPGPLLSQRSAMVMWKPLATPQLGDFDLRSNLTLFGFSASASTPLEHLAGAAAAALSEFFVCKVHVLRILAAGLPSGRLLSEGRTEALIVENAIPVRAGDAAMVASKLTLLSRDSEVTAEFARSLRTEMESRGLDVPARLQVAIRFPAAAAPTPTAPHIYRQATEGSGASTSLSTNSAIAIICVACLVTSCACALLARFWWQNRHRQGSCPNSSNTCHTHSPLPPPAKVVDATQDTGFYHTSASGKKKTNEGKDISSFLEGTGDASRKIDDLNEIKEFI